MYIIVYWGGVPALGGVDFVRHHLTYPFIVHLPLDFINKMSINIYGVSRVTFLGPTLVNKHML